MSFLTDAKKLENSNTAIVRLEQFYPFPEAQLEKLTQKYRRAKLWCWVQEEPANMGAWQFVKPRLERISKNL